MAQIRWAAGSRTAADFLRGRFFGDPASDLVSWRSGETLAISAFLLAEGRTRQGRVVVARNGAEPLIWQGHRPLRGYSGQVLVLLPPFSWGGDIELPHSMKSSFSAVAVITGDEERRVAVPRRDLTLLREVVSDDGR